MNRLLSWFLRLLKISPRTSLPVTLSLSEPPMGTGLGIPSIPTPLIESAPPLTPNLPAGGSLTEMSAAEFLDWAVAAMQVQPGRAMDLILISKLNGANRLVMALDDKDIQRLI